MPVYNGEQFIADAIRSVLAQTYPHWTLTIGNNHSKDRTLAIAEEFATKDSRIRVVTYPSFVSVVESHNNAFRLVPEDATYCRALGADDLLFPEALEKMVEVAERHPTVGLVLSYVLAGNTVVVPGYKYPDTFVPGMEVGRLRFLQNTSLFAGPSSCMLRASIVRAKQAFYNPVNYYGDLEAYIELLQRHDFGFVHQVLSYTRKGPDSRTTSYLDRVFAQTAMRILEINKFGAHFLSPEERSRILRKAKRHYYGFLGASVWEFRGREFWDYHRRHVKEMGYPMRYRLVTWYALLRLFDLIGNPLRTIRGLGRRFAAWRNRHTVMREESHGPAPKSKQQGAETDAESTTEMSAVPAVARLRRPQ